MTLVQGYTVAQYLHCTGFPVMLIIIAVPFYSVLITKACNISCRFNMGSKVYLPIHFYTTYICCFQLNVSSSITQMYINGLNMNSIYYM